MSEKCKPLSAEQVTEIVRMIRHKPERNVVLIKLFAEVSEGGCTVTSITLCDIIDALQADLRIHKQALDLAGTELLARTREFPMGHKTFSDYFLAEAKKIVEESE